MLITIHFKKTEVVINIFIIFKNELQIYFFSHKFTNKKLVINFKIQVDSYLTTANNFCYRNDNESIEFFRDKIPNFINGILNQKYILILE